MFERELEYFKENQNELCSKYPGKTLVIIGKDVVGVFNNPLEAYCQTQKKYKLGTFMIQPCIIGTDAYTITINSNNAIWT